MFDFGFSEVLLIGVVALVVLGPERLPQVARMAGLWVGRIQSLVANVKSELSKQVDVADLRDVKESVESAADSFRESMQSIERAGSPPREAAVADDLPAWERLPEQREPADFGVDDLGRPLNSADWHSDRVVHMVSLRRQAMLRQRDMRPKHRAKPRLRLRK